MYIRSGEHNSLGLMCTVVADFSFRDRPETMKMYGFLLSALIAWWRVTLS